ncbi:MAG: Cys-tRNA(Pro) deacylase [Erysipelotrichaceae bacterium]|nr:Cys-tRNA(Pro) deacylase [Erysipelotrichaceae bacterium]MBQ1533378.1 Cys-tRNA(Pro) deacylase [Erysipelotrichaceae bacterium]MBQ1788405.1 Cys-tRNA(Pro) deacylase [Erysipelotrichaceae bacterium]
MTKTNAMRMLDRAKISYEVLEYSIEKDRFSGEAVSDLLGLDYSCCYKTLGLIHEHDVYIAVISVADEIDFKKCAKALGVKNLEMIHVKDLLKLVGYERGSVSPVGVRKNKGIVFDDEVLKHEEIEISAGAMGLGLKLKTKEILDYLNADVRDIVKE